MSLLLQNEVIKDCSDNLTSLQQLCEEYFSSSSEPNPSAIRAQLWNKILVQVVKLRTLNEKAQDVVQSAKNDTIVAKQAVDQIQLDVQNIYYQHKHLRTQINLCNDYESKHDNIDLVPLEEFLLKYPEMKDAEPHELMMARLKDEEQRRLDLFIQKTKLQEQKSRLMTENKRRKEDLENLDSHLSKFIESAEPIRQVFQKY